MKQPIQATNQDTKKPTMPGTAWLYLAMFAAIGALILRILAFIAAAHAQTVHCWDAAGEVTTCPQPTVILLSSNGVAMPPTSWWSCPSNGGACDQWFGVRADTQWNSGGCITSGAVTTCESPLRVNDPTEAKRAVPDGDLPFFAGAKP